ncbi:MAG: hypothetical protein JW904_00100 [Spirochaetales bacterium]|nr:hypothetical protein [Spirochaetales bacterium]
MKKLFVYFIIISVIVSCAENIPFEHKVSDSGVGQLFVYNTELPPLFEVVVADNGIYQFNTKSRSNNTGYWQADQWELPVVTSKQELSSDEQERGWYFADIDKRKENTPADWCWVKSGEVRAFVDKTKLGNFIQEYGDKLPDLTKKQPAPLPAG